LIKKATVCVSEEDGKSSKTCRANLPSAQPPPDAGSHISTGDNAMSAQHQFYLERAAEARAGAAAATLDNVRKRWLHSEATWTEMAARSERGEKMRAMLIAEKADLAGSKVAKQG
jgi:hypothetical protein